ncbi:uncharacterized protein LOC111122014 [Crassostrea virginica]|uniref:Uncharacterized protein LOC111127192 n=1 Tax=Crassostrea virginica TaxID=6565 RepID=A0A8B8DJG4_CRAVI|nr:uncharacterized protein LOC111127192 [Crassostrea virginica]
MNTTYLLVFFITISSITAEILIRGTERVGLGSQARLQCIARENNNQQPRELRWFHNGRLVVKTYRNIITEQYNENRDGYTLSELTIPRVEDADRGRYTCKTDRKHQASLYLTVD